jgi:putative PIN family toxin of toxin-antitoxin system
MTRIILDTNVLVSSLVFGGKISRILDLVFEQEYELVLCNELEAEFLRILIQKFKANLEQIRVAKQLIQIASYFELKKPFPKASRDKNDNFLLALAEVSDSQFLISGDKDLLVLNAWKKCKILKVSEFLEL